MVAIWRSCLWALLLVGCAARPSQDPQPLGEVEIPPQSEPGDEADGAPPPPRGETSPAPPTGDPYAYYVGSWDGKVNEKLTTELVVTDDGRFHIHLPVHKHRPACDLYGKLRVTEQRILLDIDQSNCEAEIAGSTLERDIVSKTDDELVVRSTDTKLLVRYTRIRK